MPFLKIYAAVACAALIGTCGCRQQDTAVQRSEAYARQANAYQAYCEIVEARRRNAEDPELERLFWQRRLEYLLDRGRQMVFMDDEVEAIAELEKALALDPENPAAKRWIVRAKEKLAKRAVREGENQRSQGNLDAALLQFRKALSYVPEHPDAVAGIEDVNKYYKKRYDEASDHYIKGARARGEQLVVQSKYHNGIASEKDPSMREATKRQTEDARQLGRERYERARKMEEKGFYGAALMEYEAVFAVVPDLEGLKERIAAAKKEVDALELRRKAEMAMRRNEFDEADKLLNKAYDLTQAQKADLSGLLADNRQRRYEDRYRKAKDLELEYQFEAALEAYVAIDKAWSAGFLDVKARINTLSEDIEQAGKSMAEGQKLEKAGDLKKAIELYEEALTVYPGYKGLDQRVKGLKAKIQN
ncbi:MAG: hypothetical protein ACYTKC_11685 [Planctomycetota bacterium]